MLTAMKVWTRQIHSRWDCYTLRNPLATTPAILIACDSVEERDALLKLLQGAADAERAAAKT